jgi:hypothetical protein
MAKKTVGKVKQHGAQAMAKVIIARRASQEAPYSFSEQMVAAQEVKNVLTKK